MKKEIILGAFIILALAIASVFILTIKSVPLEKGYKIYVFFNDAGGLLEKAKVRASGVKIGEVREIALEKKKARITLWIKKNVKIHRDAKISIMATGLLGVKYVEIDLGSDTEPILKDGDKINGIDPISTEKMISDGMKGLQGLSTALDKLSAGGKITQDLDQLLVNLNKLSNKINETINKDEIKKIVNNINEFTERLNKISNETSNLITSNKENVENIVKTLKDTSEKISTVVKKIESSIESKDTTIGMLLGDTKLKQDLTDAADSIKESISSIQKMSDSIKTTSEDAQKVLSRFTLTKTYWDYKFTYEPSKPEYLNKIGLYIQPKPYKFYYAGVNITGADTFDSLNLLIGRSFSNLTVYGGMIRSKAGVGGIYRILGGAGLFSNLNFIFESYDFAKEKPQLDLNFTVRLLSWMYIGFGIEDLLTERKYISSFNIYAYDEDIAYILGLVGLAR